MQCNGPSPWMMLKAAALHFARANGLIEVGSLSVSVRIEDNAVTITTPISEADLTEPPAENSPAELATPMPAGNAHWKWLTDEENAIIPVASTTEWRTASKLSELSGVPRDRDFDALLRFMCSRNILESAHGKGYRLKNPPQEPIPGHVPAVSRQFSPTEEAIMAVVGHDWMTKVQISEALKMPISSSFCALLTNLAEREYLESGNRGYRLPGRGKPARRHKPAKPADDDPLERLIVGKVRSAGHRLSLGEILGELGEQDANDVKVAVQRLVQAGELHNGDGLYSAS